MLKKIIIKLNYLTTRETLRCRVMKFQGDLWGESGCPSPSPRVAGMNRCHERGSADVPVLAAVPV
jgi:hypothetical protein